jgi:hypothetical protein
MTQRADNFKKLAKPTKTTSLEFLFFCRARGIRRNALDPYPPRLYCNAKQFSADRSVSRERAIGEFCAWKHDYENKIKAWRTRNPKQARKLDDARAKLDLDRRRLRDKRVRDDVG